MLSALAIFNAKGDVLISRIYRPDVRRSAADLFRIHVVSSTDIRSPLLTIANMTFFHIKHENIFLVAITKSSSINACMVYEFLNRIVRLGVSYFRTFNEDAVKRNFTLIYELLDEICDFGIPQNTESETLKMYITTEGIQSDRAANDGSRIAIQATGAVSWRRPDIKYRKNEVFVDVIESINLIMSPKGTVLRSDISGKIVMRAYLTGMPECKFGLNDKVLLEKEGKPVSGNPHSSSTSKASTSVELDDCQFHQCVKLGRFDSDRTINFIPPDGEFELMRYRTTENISLPFKVHAVVNELSATRVEFRVAVKSLFSSKVYAQNIIIKIPTPLNTASTKINVTAGKAKYNGAENCMVWKIARFQGHDETLFSAEAELTSTTVKKVWSRPPSHLISRF
ncbi:clathrin associated protein complex medium subunit [Batrachochytrium dendrobatidis]